MTRFSFVRPDGATIGLAAQVIYDVQETREIRRYRPSVYQRGLEDFFFAFFWGQGIYIDEQAWSPFYNANLLGLIEKISGGSGLRMLDYTESKSDDLFQNYPIKDKVVDQLKALPDALINLPSAWEILLLSDFASFGPGRRLGMHGSSNEDSTGYIRPFREEVDLIEQVPEEAVQFALPRIREWFSPQIGKSELNNFIRKTFTTHIASGWAYYIDCDANNVSFLSSATRTSLWLSQLSLKNQRKSETLKRVFLPYVFARFIKRLPFDADPEEFVSELVDFCLNPTKSDKEAQEILSELFQIDDGEKFNREIARYKTILERDIRKTGVDQISFVLGKTFSGKLNGLPDTLPPSWWLRHFQLDELDLQNTIRSRLEKIFPHTFMSSDISFFRKIGKNQIQPEIKNQNTLDRTPILPIRIFVASPSDVKTERSILREVVNELNRTIAPDYNCFVQLITFEDNVHPEMGRPQQVINNQIGYYDVFFGIMWNRFGTPTGEAESGTEEEFRKAYEEWEKDQDRPVMFYFCEHPTNFITEEELEQKLKVLRFANELKQMGVIWYYRNADSFADTIRPHLTNVLKEITSSNRYMPRNIEAIPLQTDKSFPATNCSLALAFGKQISSVNSIDNHSQFRYSLVRALAEREYIQVEAIVPIPHAGIFLATCWTEFRDERLWLALGHTQWNSSMFRVSNNLDARIRFAQEKVGRLKEKEIVSSVMLIDEAILSGATMYQAIKTLKGAGVKRIHIRTLLPPISKKCPYDVTNYNPGIGFERKWLHDPGNNELVANGLGADDFRSLHVETIRSISLPRPLCVECFDGTEND